MLILATTPSFIRALGFAGCEGDIKKEGFEVFMSDMHPPFSFDPNQVFAIAVGEQKIGKAELEYFPNLKIIARFGRGLDAIDVGAVKEKGVQLTTVPHGSNGAVAELTMGFIFSLARKISFFDRAIKQGVWERDYTGGVSGKILGVIGFGEIGRMVAQAAKRNGMKILVHSTSVSKEAEKEYDVVSVPLEQLLRESHFVSLHVPLKEETRDLISESALSTMRRDAFLINTSRGAVVDEGALLDALDRGTIAGAALDVFSSEPVFSGGVSQKLALHPKVIATPHIASFTDHAHGEIARSVIKNIIAARDARWGDLEGVV